jgi:hypothetical protein
VQVPVEQAAGSLTRRRAWTRYAEMNRWQLGAVAGVLLLACSDSNGDTPGACEPVVACGGDVVGTWRIESGCSDQTREQAIDTLEEELPPECSGSLESAESDASDVSITFDAAGMMMISGTTALRLQYTFGDACLSAMSPEQGGASEARCNQLGPDTMGPTGAGPLGVATCAFADGACACEYFFQPDVSASALYTVADDRITIEDESLPYCVSGDVLRLGVPTVGTSVARRQ